MIAPPLALSICGSTAFAGPVDRAEIEVESRLELRFVEVHRSACDHDADIVVQDVDAAEIAPWRAATAASTRRGLVTSAASAMRVAALGGDDARGLRRRSAPRSIAGDPRAFARVGDRRGLAVAPAGPGGARAEDEGDLVLQAHGAAAHRKPIEIHGTAATTIMPISSASM